MPPYENMPQCDPRDVAKFSGEKIDRLTEQLDAAYVAVRDVQRAHDATRTLVKDLIVAAREYGSLPLPIAYHVFLVRMHEAHVPEAEGNVYVPEIRRYEIQSALARGDEETAEKYFIDMYAAQKHR